MDIFVSATVALATLVFVYSLHILNMNRERRSRVINSIGLVFFMLLAGAFIYLYNKPSSDTYLVSKTTNQYDRAIIVTDAQGCAFALAHNVEEDMSKAPTSASVPQTIDIYGRVRRVPDIDASSCKRN